MAEELRTAYHAELDQIRDEIVRLGAMVTEALPRATEVLLNGDLAEAQRMIEGDDAFDALSMQIEEHCLRVLALQNPMAADMRAVVAALKLNSELERSADLVANICKAVRRMYGLELSPRLRGLIEQMSEEAARLNRLGIDAYVESDAALAAALDDMDDRLDALQADYIQAIFEGHHEGATLSVQEAVQLALVGRFYERIGDHAVNVGEQVQYMVTGWLPEHAGAQRHLLRESGDPEIARADSNDAEGAGVDGGDPAASGDEA
ncbi:MAG: phosphate signaling complex protein PhoU [Acidimicrobiia bacterium]|nr:phosphate signaling complex protein PhoU [Acidimicrobiia bacterium]